MANYIITKRLIIMYVLDVQNDTDQSSTYKIVESALRKMSTQQLVIARGWIEETLVPDHPYYPQIEDLSSLVWDLMGYHVKMVIGDEE